MRTVEEIELIFREIGLSESTWGRMNEPGVMSGDDPVPTEVVFIRFETTTTPLEKKADAHLA